MARNPNARTHILVGFISLIALFKPLSSRRALIDPYLPTVLTPIDSIPYANLLNTHEERVDKARKAPKHPNVQLEMARADSLDSKAKTLTQAPNNTTKPLSNNNSLKDSEPSKKPNNNVNKPHNDSPQTSKNDAEDKKGTSEAKGEFNPDKQLREKDNEVVKATGKENDNESENKDKEASHLGTLHNILCYIGFNSFCSADELSAVEKNSAEEENTTDIEPVASKNCFEYGHPGAISSDWNNPEEHGWVVVNDMGTNKFTTKSALKSYRTVQQLRIRGRIEIGKYSITQGSDSIGGIVLRAMTDEEISVMLNTSTKTVALSRKNNNEYSEILEKPSNNINSNFLHKLSVIDSGYKGRVDVILDGTPVMKVDDLFFKTSGGFGLRVEKGSVLFSDVTVEPLD